MKYSVIICTFNGQSFIVEQLSSILNQEILPEKIIISDDNSDDNTRNIIEVFFSEKKFTNYEIIHNNYRSVISNFLYGLKYSHSDYIFLADQDDIWCKNKVIEFNNVFVKTNSRIPTLVFSDACLVNQDNILISPSFFSYQGLTEKSIRDDSILYKNCVQGASCAINKELQLLILDSLKIINIDNIYMHDWWIALLAKYYGNAIFINKQLIRYRQHKNNQVGAFNYRLRFFYYIKYISLYLRNFNKAVVQTREFTYFSHVYKKKIQLTPFQEARKRQYNEVSKIKKLLLRLFSL